MAYKANRDELFGSGGDNAKPKGAASGQKAAAKKPAVLASKSASPPSLRTAAKPSKPNATELKQKEEAEAMEKEADKFLTKPSFALFWKPDYRSAALQLEKAANRLQLAKFFSKATVGLWARAAECQAKAE